MLGSRFWRIGGVRCHCFVLRSVLVLCDSGFARFAIVIQFFKSKVDAVLEVSIGFGN